MFLGGVETAVSLPQAIGAGGGRSPPPAPMVLWEGKGRFEPRKRTKPDHGTKIWFREHLWVALRRSAYKVPRVFGKVPPDLRFRGSLEAISSVGALKSILQGPGEGSSMFNVHLVVVAAAAAATDHWIGRAVGRQHGTLMVVLMRRIARPAGVTV